MVNRTNEKATYGKSKICSDNVFSRAKKQKGLPFLSEALFRAVLRPEIIN